MVSEKVLEIIEDEARRVMSDDPAHGWPHVERVRMLTRRIVREEGLRVDPHILEAAVLLHDIGRFLPGEGHHAEKSAAFGSRLLASLGVPPETIEKVTHAVLAHSYSLGVRAETLEAMILSDADKLDALGAVGIARAFHHGCQRGRGFDDTIAHVESKLVRLPDLMYLETSRRMALERVELIKRFLEAYKVETGRHE